MRDALTTLVVRAMDGESEALLGFINSGSEVVIAAVLFNFLNSFSCQTQHFFSPAVLECFNGLFASLPLAAVIGNTIFCVYQSLHRSISCVCFHFRFCMVRSARWIAPFPKGSRGSGLLFGPAAVESFHNRRTSSF
jgi:hypothetical protein